MGGASLDIFASTPTAQSVELVLAGLALTTFTISYIYGLVNSHPLVLDPVSFVKQHLNPDEYGTN